MDEQVGRLLDHLELLGQTQNTIVIFHGDHGYHLGEQGLWTKKTCFELGARVPLIIAAPHLTASHGKRTSQMAELVDVYPTVAGLAGLPSPPDVDGASLMLAFADPTALASANDYAFTEFPQCPDDPEVNLWHTEGGCQNVAREQIKFFGFSIRSASFRYTEWHPWSPQLRADWNTMTGVVVCLPNDSPSVLLSHRDIVDIHLLSSFLFVPFLHLLVLFFTFGIHDCLLG